MNPVRPESCGSSSRATVRYPLLSTHQGRTHMIGSGSSGSIQPAPHARHRKESAIHSVSCQTSGWICSRVRWLKSLQPQATSWEPQAGQLVGPPRTSTFSDSSMRRPARSDNSWAATDRDCRGRPRGAPVPVSWPEVTRSMVPERNARDCRFLFDQGCCVNGLLGGCSRWWRWGLISLSALGSAQSVRGSCLGFSIPCRAVRRPESNGSLPRQDRGAGWSAP